MCVDVLTVSRYKRKESYSWSHAGAPIYLSACKLPMKHGFLNLEMVEGACHLPHRSTKRMQHKRVTQAHFAERELEVAQGFSCFALHGVLCFLT